MWSHHAHTIHGLLDVRSLQYMTTSRTEKKILNKTYVMRYKEHKNPSSVRISPRTKIKLSMSVYRTRKQSNAKNHISFANKPERGTENSRSHNNNDYLL